YQLPTTNYQLPTTNYQLPTTNYQLPTTNYQLPTTNYQLPTTNYQLPTTNYRSVAVIILAIHHVGSPRVEADVHHFLDTVGLRVDDHHRILGRVRQVQLLVLGVRRGGLELDVRADLDAAGGL